MTIKPVGIAGWLQTVNDNFELLNSEVSGEVYYVDCNAGLDTNDGKSWETAFKLLSVALAASHANIAASSRGWAARNRIYVKADQTIDADGEDLTKLAQKTDVIGVGSVDHLLGARIIGNHVPDGAFMGCRFINMIFKAPAAGGDIWTVPTTVSGLSFIGCKFDGGSTTPASGALVITTSESLTIEDCVFTGAFSDSVIELAGTEFNSLMIRNNVIQGADVGIEAKSTVTTSVRAGYIMDNVINTTKEGVLESSGKLYVHGNRVVTGNAKGTAGAGAIVAGAYMMLANKVSCSNVANADVPALGAL